MELVNEAIKCKICKKLMNSPVILPCDKSVCKVHTEGKDTIYCEICDKDHSVPKEGFILNKDLDIIIQTQIHKCDFGTEYKTSFDNCKKLEKYQKKQNFLKMIPAFIFARLQTKSRMKSI